MLLTEPSSNGQLPPLQVAKAGLRILPNRHVLKSCSRELVDLAKLIAEDLIREGKLGDTRETVGLVFLDRRFITLRYIPGCPVQRLIFSHAPSLLLELDKNQGRGME